MSLVEQITYDGQDEGKDREKEEHVRDRVRYHHSQPEGRHDPHDHDRNVRICAVLQRFPLETSLETKTSERHYIVPRRTKSGSEWGTVGVRRRDRDEVRP